MESTFRDDVALCPNCNKIFAITYLPKKECPFCGSYLTPYDTMAGCPMRDPYSQKEMAEDLQFEREMNNGHN